MTLYEKIENNKKELTILEQKKANLERNIANLKRKIENQEFALANPPKPKKKKEDTSSNQNKE